MPTYAELHAHSAYTFLDGTDMPADLVARAQELGLSGIGILDVDGMYSVIQTARAAREQDFPCVYGAELTLADDPLPVGIEFAGGQGLPPGTAHTQLRLPVLTSSPAGYHSLCRAISAHNLAAGGPRIPRWTLAELAAGAHPDWYILTGTSHGILRRALAIGGRPAAAQTLDALVAAFGSSRVVVEAALAAEDSAELAQTLHWLASRASLPLVATGAVRSADGGPLADVMAALRLRESVESAIGQLPHAASFLRSDNEMRQIHRHFPGAVDAAGELAAQCTFDFSLIKAQLPRATVPPGHTDDSWLRELTNRGATDRYGSTAKNPRAWQVLNHELGVIAELGFSGYFLIVKDIVDFCQRQNILCQGRGSAANSAVCYALQITPVDAVKHRMLFERFLSSGRTDPPDIDLDIEAKQREKVIQYVYQRYGRDNAAQVANTISYRPRSAVRDAARALGYSPQQANSWSKHLPRGWHRRAEKMTAPAGLPPLVLEVAAALQKLPRHMGIHPGGMVLTRTPVSEICPVMWASKEDRSVLQWDKDDCEAAGLVKFDLLGLGMLTVLRRCFNQLTDLGVTGSDGKPLGLYNLPAEDPRVYDLLCAAETVGVFQVESRAQMSTLPRLQPRQFYDLVIEVALIRPGPIQGKAVNPYLRRRRGQEPALCDPRLAPLLEKTLGVPLFQEQLMQIAITAAGFTPTEASELRRMLSSKDHEQKMADLKPRLFSAMHERGYSAEVQEQIYESLRGFAEFGFPESHAFSFAYLVYASAWLKVYFPEHFYAALLTSQPMGFYSVSSLVADARRLGVRVLGPSVRHSAVRARAVAAEPARPGEPNESGEWDEPGELGLPDQRAAVVADLCDYEALPSGKLMRTSAQRHIRLGLESIKGLSADAQQRIVDSRPSGHFTMQELAVAAELGEKELQLLASAGAFVDLGLSRREALWFAARFAAPASYQPCIPGTEMGSELPVLPPMSAAETVQADYQSMALSAISHPLGLLRAELSDQGVWPVQQLPTAADGTVLRTAGLVTHRQRPGTAQGVTFLSLEDETGLVNVVCTVGFWRRYRQLALGSSALIVTGRLEKKDGALSLRAQKLESLQVDLPVRSRDFR